MSNIGTAQQSIGEEDVLRARFYTLLSNLLLAPPPAGVLADLGGLTGDDTPLGQALGDLAAAAREADADAVSEEHLAVLVGITRGEVVPYASHYLTGFLHEKPLAEVRESLRALGVERAPGQAEPEDHIGILFDVMRGLILGEFGAAAGAGLAEQKAFFTRHIAPWADTLFRDIEAARSARFYRAVGAVGRAFLDIERESFAMVGEKGEG
ncbi:molecular chaperone [Caenispirillum salinarum]|uniref:TorD/DmsD family molecular chaperone n=1 Tax=Caenispirillum salinarum TaxID=859058 RepID=UPI00384D764F